MIGNAGTVDVLGYLNPEENQNPGVSHILTRIDCNIN